VHLGKAPPAGRLVVALLPKELTRPVPVLVTTTLRERMGVQAQKTWRGTTGGLLA